MSSKEAGVFGVEDCDLFKLASRIVGKEQNSNIFLKKDDDKIFSFGYIDVTGKNKILGIGLDNDGSQILIFQTKIISGDREKINQYKVFGITENKMEECLLRAMEINQRENTGESEKIEIRSTMRQDVFLTGHPNCF